MLKAIDNPGVKTIVYSPKFSSICSIDGIPFQGVMHIEYYPQTNMLEFGSFENWLRADVAKLQTTVESLAVIVLNTLNGALQKGTSIKVTIEADTIGHGSVKVCVWNDAWTL